MPASCNALDCPCTNTECARHGKCCECLASHRERNYLPACLRPDPASHDHLPIWPDRPMAE